MNRGDVLIKGPQERRRKAVQRAMINVMATKITDQRELTALHRMRERLISRRTGVINQIRAYCHA